MSADDKTPLALIQPKVIDPDDKAEMERFARLHGEAWKRVMERNPGRGGTPNWEIVAEQFRLFRDPSYRKKPDEPMGLGAVVEDEQGRYWVRSDEIDELPWHEPDSGDNDWRNYADVDAIRVLSDGVERSTHPTTDQPDTQTDQEDR